MRNNAKKTVELLRHEWKLTPDMYLIRKCGMVSRGVQYPLQ
jgi:hypothetical protein